MRDSNLIYITLGLVIWFCFLTCRYLCKNSASPHSVMATPTHTMEGSTTRRPYSQQYHQQPTAVPEPCQSYQGVPYQLVPGQPGYPAQPGDLAPCDNPAEPMITSPNREQAFILRLPPSYQDAIGPTYPLQPMPSSQPAYLLNPLAQPQPNALPDGTDFLAHSAYTPEFVLH